MDIGLKVVAYRSDVEVVDESRSTFVVVDEGPNRFVVAENGGHVLLMRWSMKGLGEKI